MALPGSVWHKGQGLWNPQYNGSQPCSLNCSIKDNLPTITHTPSIPVSKSST